MVERRSFGRAAAWLGWADDDKCACPECEEWRGEREGDAAECGAPDAGRGGGHNTLMSFKATGMLAI